MCYIGKGTNLWNNVHIDDLTTLYIIVLKHALEITKTGIKRSPYESFYTACAYEHCWGDIAKRLGTILHKRGVVDTAECKSIKLEEAPSLLAVSTNSRAVSEAGKKLGWKPQRKPIEEYLKEDVEGVLEAHKK